MRYYFASFFAEAPLAVGTMVFMAPETFVNVKVELDQQTDVWALGVILMWMVTALELGSLQHPCLDRDEGEEFDVKWIALYLGSLQFFVWGMVDFQKKSSLSLRNGMKMKIMEVLDIICCRFFFCTFKFWLFFLRHNAFRDQVPWNRSLIPGQLAVASILDKVGPNRNSMVLKNLQNLRLKSWGKGVPRRNKTLLMMDDKLLLRPAVSSKKRGIEGSGEVLVYQPDQRCHACSILEAGVCWWGL